jgi:hypothetical protein
MDQPSNNPFAFDQSDYSVLHRYVDGIKYGLLPPRDDGGPTSSELSVLQAVAARVLREVETRSIDSFTRDEIELVRRSGTALRSKADAVDEIYADVLGSSLGRRQTGTDLLAVAAKMASDRTY